MPDKSKRNLGPFGFILIALLSAVGLGACRNDPPPTVTLTWRRSPSTPESSVKSYNVYRRAEPGNPYTRIASGVPVTTYDDHTAKPDTTYVYAVTVVDTQGHESRFSNVVTVKTP